ncbi:hypothetical protein [Mesorhizobium sp. Pch-S]|uniref:hypothetical protein n=1 Tax=Mesorhizobium sp. Pch-S TaxID=2082387 RepID=UPI00101260BE|nr:hypothetical protein [Mesorhizobium sp. Pch-S]
MAEDTIFRFALANKLARIKYGASEIVSRSDAQRAWPPTGDHDTSDEGAFRAMALAHGGHSQRHPTRRKSAF